MNVSDSHHFRKMIAGACMVLAPVLALIAFVVAPRFATAEAERLAIVAGDLDRFYAASLIGLVAVVLFVPVVLGLMHMLR